MLKAVKKTRASEDVVKQIVNLIKKGRLKKGDQLPAERELTEKFQVSRTTVREAIRSLESMRLVECKQGNGTYVMVSSTEACIKPLTLGLFTPEDDLMDIFYLRKIIEPSIAQLAAGYATAEDLKELEDILKKQETQADAGRNMADSMFHLTLARIARNRVLGRLLYALVELMATTHEGVPSNTMRADKSLKGHEAILSAIKREDCSEARKAMLSHLSEIENLLFKGKKGGGKCR